MPAARREGKSLDLGTTALLDAMVRGWVIRLTFPGWRGPNIQGSDFILCQCNEPWVTYRWFLLWKYVTYQRLRCFSVINRIHGETWSSLIISSLDRFTLAIWIPGNKIQAPLGMWKTKVALSQNVPTASAHKSFLSLRPFGHASKKSVPSKYKWQSIYTYLVLPFTVHLPGKLQFCLLFKTWFILRWKECKHLLFFEEIQLSFASKLPNLQIACPHTSPYSNSLLETGSMVPWFWPQSW